MSTPMSEEDIQGTLRFVEQVEDAMERTGDIDTESTLARLNELIDRLYGEKARFENGDIDERQMCRAVVLELDCRRLRDRIMSATGRSWIHEQLSRPN